MNDSTCGLHDKIAELETKNADLQAQFDFLQEWRELITASKELFDLPHAPTPADSLREQLDEARCQIVDLERQLQERTADLRKLRHELHTESGLDFGDTPKAKFPIGTRVRSTCEFITCARGFEKTVPAGWLGTVKEHWKDGRIMVVMDSTNDEVHTFRNDTDALEVSDE